MDPTTEERPLRCLLIANRGEIARRIIRSARAMGIRTVALYSDPDRDLPHAREADLAVHLPGASPAETYLRVERIIAAARRAGADSVHPGYGFLSENAGFARACADAGLTFVGPSIEAIEQMGSKLASKALMERAGVPVLPSYEVLGREARDDLLVAADRVGYPVLVKASAGGGGRGMRVVPAADQLIDAIEGARREATSAFGDGTVFLERYVESSRHVEVQVLGDTHGKVVGLFERECSIQRRHQKIIEEAPSPVVDADLRKRMVDAAVTAAETIGYVGAGTVEFLLTDTGEFFFLEMNTRLQVEHPVTELITGLDLVRAQLEIAAGAPLRPEVTGASISGHAIEARLYAEDPTADWRPATGRLSCFELPKLNGVRLDAGFESGSTVTPHYDPMLAKVIAWAPSRPEAIQLLTSALRGARIHGVKTNRDLLVSVLEHPEFEAGHTDTHFLARHEPASLQRQARHPDLIQVHATAAALAQLAEGHSQVKVTRLAPIGWTNGFMPPFRQEFLVDDEPVEVSVRQLRSGPEVVVAGQLIDGVEALRVEPDLTELVLGGLRYRVRIHRHDDQHDTDSALGSLTLTAVPRLPVPGEHVAEGSLLAPMPGSLVRILTSVGDHVSAGQPLVVLEAMKMEHTIAAPADGVVCEVNVAEGDQVDTGAVLIVVDETDTGSNEVGSGQDPA